MRICSWKSLRLLKDTMRGLKKVMQENACDSALVQRLDRNMIQAFNTLHTAP